ncbi:hypothetical protein [Oceanirhabdus seepicola]|uniref:N-acetylmuramoyl-L-alanine amidase n=1 Tax=Oceanirhabdus seepicola TaxID=2828781 RepID=A0A9J6NWZ8_9CLOT|nr:hypothetical protein [Oceanirhabdus seepicola]MCM1988787.1 hypothetical protein [Oceanirhabdus seepicola]
MKKIFSFVLSIALLGNIVCSTVALAETDSKVEKKITKSYSIIVHSSIDPDSDPGF